MSDNKYQKYKTDLAMYAANRRVGIWTDPMKESDKRTYYCEQSEDGKPTGDRRFLFSQSLDPWFPTKMKIKMPYDVGEEKEAYNHMSQHPLDITAISDFKLYAGGKNECRCKNKHPIA